MIDFLQYSFNGLLTGMVYAMIALSFIVIYRAARIFNFAQGEIVTVGGFLVWMFLTSLHWPLWIGIPAALAAMALLGIVVERVVFRPLIGQPLFSLVMVTIGLSILFRGLMLVIWGPDPRPFPAILPRASIEIGPFVFIDQGLFWGGFFALLCVASMSWLFGHTKLGLQLTAVAEDHEVAQSLGISVKKAIAIAWALSGVLSLLGAISFLNAKSVSFTAADIGMTAIPVAMLVGFESIGGVLVGGAIIGLAQAWAGAYLDGLVGGGTGSIAPYVLMLPALLIRPTGLFGWKTIERV